MKSITVAIIFCALIFFVLSCKKDTASKSNDKVNASPTAISHSWELRYQEGGYGPTHSPYYSPGNGNMWKFTDTTYQVYFEGQISSSGTYYMIKDTCPATKQLMDAIVLNWGQSYNDTIYVQIAGDTLTMYRGIIASDGTIEKYVRIKQ